jgi:hypothetical protein
MRPGTGQLNCCDKCGGGSQPVCGDGKCQGDERKTCPQDCPAPKPPVCGDGKCQGDEHKSCPQDCIKGDSTDWCASADDGKGGSITKGTDCPSCFSIGMLDAPDNRSCVDPCSTEGILIFSCMSWCPSLNDGHGGFIQAAQYAACTPCKFGDNGIRCLAEGEGKCPDCNGGGFDPTLLYVIIVMVGLGLILLVVLLAKKGKPTKCPKCGKMAVKNGVCRACWHEVTPTAKPASPTPPVPRPTGSGPSAPTTAP